MIAPNTVVAQKDKQALRDAIENAQLIAICGHANPDGDCLGSCMALGAYCESLGKEVTYHVPDEPGYSKELFEKIASFQTTIRDHTYYELLLCVDTANQERTILDESILLTIADKLFVVDHHLGNEFSAGTLLIDHTTASACELVAELLEERGFDLSSDDGLIANYLLMGILTDTGNFSWGQQPAKTLHVAGSLIEYGADKDRLVSMLFRRESFTKIKEIGRLLGTIQQTGSIVWCAVRVSELEARGIDDGGIGHVLFSMQKIDLDGIFLLIKIVDTTDEQAALKISFRSRRKHFDVCAIAQQFGGGGHKQAAGAKIILQGADQADTMIARILEQINTTIDQQRLASTT